MIKKNSKKEFNLSHRLYSAAELKSLLKDVGFKKVTASGDLLGAPYDTKARRLVIVASK